MPGACILLTTTHDAGLAGRLAAPGTAVLVLLAALDVKASNAVFSGLREVVVMHFAWLFTSFTTACVIAVAALACLPQARARLGPADARPVFTRASWLAMLFSAGLASGILYWGAAEPIAHLQANPFLERFDIAANSPEAARLALTITTFHWGLHGWALYVLGGLGIAIAAYRHNQPLTFRSALYGVFGTRLHGAIGQCIDVLALLGTVLGVATSIGLAVAGMNATLNAVFGIAIGLPMQLAVIGVVTTLGTLSALSGVVKGIRLLSLANVWVSLLLLAAVLWLGPTRELLTAMTHTTADYAQQVLPMGFYVATQPDDQRWQGDWTVFYWAWWLAWMPFVSLFVARISYGRTIREFIVWVMWVPTVVVIVWMSVFGGTALDQELTSPGSISTLVGADYSQGIVAVIASLGDPPLVTALMVVTACLLFSWLITSLDSATLVICNLVGGGERATTKVTWGVLLGAVSGVLLAAGGVPALQSASIIIGLPVAVLAMLALASVVRGVLRATP